MKFRIIDTNNNSNVLGGDVSEENSHLTVNMSNRAKDHRLLKVGESMVSYFYCSGSSGWYKVLRVE